MRRIIVSLGIFTLTAFGVPAWAATGIHVNTTQDVVNPTDGHCSLREAISSANTTTPSGTSRGECPAGNTILLKKKTYVLSISGADEDGNATGDLDIHNNVTIVGKRKTTIEQTTGDRVLEIFASTTVELDRVRITDGKARAGQPVAGQVTGEDGGGIFNLGTLTLRRSTVTGNAAGDGSQTSTADGSGGNGGGIYSTGTLTLDRVVVSGNKAGTAGSGTVTGSPAPGGTGGGIAVGGTLHISGSTISGNRSGDGSAGTSTAAGSAGGIGGGINSAATGTIVGSTIANNISGSGGNGFDAVVFGATGGTGGDGSSGGGLAVATGSLTVTTSTISGNHSGSGGRGGIGGFSSGVAGGTGGTGGQGGFGAGIATAGNLTLDRSTVSSNVSGVGGHGGPGGTGTPDGMSGASGTDGLGGGIVVSGGSLVATNDTVSGNRASSGGGIIGAGPVSLNNVTVANNQAETDGGGIDRINSAFTLENSIVAANTAASDPDCEGTVVADDYNLVQAGSGCVGLGSTDITGSSPKLGKLKKNGGPTKTQKPSRHSVAINHGNPAAPGTIPGTCETIDQRGKKRKRSRCDIGSVEAR